MPLVPVDEVVDLTVCVPAYNAADGIERALRSVATQAFDGRLEILVCDDGSTDSTVDVVENLRREFPAIRVIRNRRNRGRPFTRNRLVRDARGRFLTWLDADDEKYPGMLAAQWDLLRQVESTEGSEGLSGLLVYTNFDWLRPEMDAPKLMNPPESADPLESLLDSSFGGYLWLTMGLRDTYVTAGPFDERLPRLQDLGFFIRFAELGGTFRRIESAEPMCVYHKDDGGRDSLAVWQSWCRIYRQHRHHYVSYGHENARKWRRHQYRVARRFARANDDRVTFARVAAREVVFVVEGRLRRVFLDA